MKHYELNLRDYWRVLRRRKGIILFSTILLGVFSFFFANLQKPVPIYQTSVSVKVENSNVASGVYGEALALGTGDYLETQAQVIKSYPVLERAAKKLSLLDASVTSEQVRENDAYLLPILGLRGQLKTRQEGATNILEIMVTAGDPGFAQRLANAVAQAYQEENVRDKNRQAQQQQKFIEEQLQVVGEKLRQAEKQVQVFREHYALVSVDSVASTTMNRLSQVKTKRQELQQLLNELRDIRQQLQTHRVLDPTRIKGFLGESMGAVFTNLNATLINQTTKRQALLVFYTEEHPEIQQLTVEIEKMAREMLAQAVAQESVMQKREASLAAEQEELETTLKTLPQLGLQLEKLQKEERLHGQNFALLESKYQEILIKRAGQIQEVSIVRPALKPTVPINPPSTLPTGVAGVIVGGILGLVFAFILETLDTSLGTIEDVEELLGTSVLGLVPYIDTRALQVGMESRGLVDHSPEVVERNARLVSHFDPKSSLAESYRTLRTNIQFLLLEKHIKTLILTSSLSGEGKTTTTANLAMTFAQAGTRVLLIDADMRRAMQHNIFGLDREPGLSDVILGNYEWPETIRTVADIIVGNMGMEAIMLTPGMDNLHIMTAGTTPPNPAELLGSQRMTDFIAQVREAYDLVIFDAPPVLQVSDATILGSKVEGLTLVYQVGKIARGSLMRSKKQLDHVKANILGTVLNGLRPEMGDYSDYGYQSYYGGYYGSDTPDHDQTNRGQPPGERSFNGGAGGQVAATGQGRLRRMATVVSRLRSPLGLLLLGVFLLLGGLVGWQVKGGHPGLLFTRWANPSANAPAQSTAILPHPQSSPVRTASLVPVILPGVHGRPAMEAGQAIISSDSPSPAGKHNTSDLLTPDTFLAQKRLNPQGRAYSPEGHTGDEPGALKHGRSTVLREPDGKEPLPQIVPAVPTDVRVATGNPATTKRAFAVQVGAFLVQQHATTSREDLQGKGYTPSIVQVWDARQRLWHTVRTGAYASREEAAQAAVAFMEKEKRPAIVQRVDF